MADSIAHRGPDDEGYFVGARSASASGGCRSSISPAGISRCPMPRRRSGSSSTARSTTSRNCAPSSSSAAHRFRTRSDTEVIVHGYKQWGTDVFDRLNGMFGLAIWDVRRRRLVVARDAMGIKLVYYRIAGGRLTFGSEIRAVLAAEGTSPDVDPVALNLFLQFRYTPSPLTIFKGSASCAPGTMLVVEDGKCREERWYNYTPMPFSDPQGAKTKRHEELLRSLQGGGRSGTCSATCRLASCSAAGSIPGCCWR